jgi:hypothetical protein
MDSSAIICTEPFHVPVALTPFDILRYVISTDFTNFGVRENLSEVTNHNGFKIHINSE